MAVKPKPAVFETSDGQEFATKKEADAHEELHQAESDFRNARERLGRAAANTVKTADGELFDFSRWSSYYVVHKYGAFGPSLHRVDFGYGTEVVLGGSCDDQVKLVLREKDQSRQFDIADLYSSEEKAKTALAQAIREHIAEKQEELAKMEMSKR